MKSMRHIFTFIFVGAMLFTVYSYLPLQEELPCSKYELAKKNDRCPESGNDEGGDEPEQENCSDFDVPNSTGFGNDASLASKLTHPSPLYRELPGKLNTPPPKI
jgi:hypothetical protein